MKCETCKCYAKTVKNVPMCTWSLKADTVLIGAKAAMEIALLGNTVKCQHYVPHRKFN